jgi:hypothetical protein
VREDGLFSKCGGEPRSVEPEALIPPFRAAGAIACVVAICAFGAIYFATTAAAGIRLFSKCGGESAFLSE